MNAKGLGENHLSPFSLFVPRLFQSKRDLLRHKEKV